ncbi:hypothetical protein [Algibacter mikhailovii]|uniref:Uncharacterized protein n=1 Tax=Algibacter mikhailovii TaxID=425498 RepID=A0A918VG13_9FLAO|nr:hypothetical protein [Algibacter mikhailovii]GGZ95138.1 hypothetical protein GCM10007028_36520 [Algibacter mikhailovii]
MKNPISILFFFLITIFSYSQQIIKEYGNNEYIDSLDTELLKKVSNKLNLEYKDIYEDKSFSIKYNEKITFFTIRYITKRFETENYYTTKFLFVSNKGKLISQIDNDNLSYSDDEVMQPSKTRILKKLIPLNNTTNGIGLTNEFSSPSCVSLYSKNLLTILILKKNKIEKILTDYPIRETQGDSNCNGSFKIEFIESTLYVEEKKSNELSNLKVIQKHDYEEFIEEDLKKNIKEFNLKKNETESYILKFNGEKYKFNSNNKLLFLKYE